MSLMLFTYAGTFDVGLSEFLLAVFACYYNILPTLDIGPTLELRWVLG
jgi:hypothetical protein